jgi:hypothetical protein
VTEKKQTELPIIAGTIMLISGGFKQLAFAGVLAAILLGDSGIPFYLKQGKDHAVLSIYNIPQVLNVFI